MKTLLYKQLRLVCHPMTPVFCLFGFMVIIPNYPYTVIFFYVMLGLVFTFLNMREQKDLYYTALLPVPKRDAVKAGCLFTALIELLSLVVLAPCALLAVRLQPGKDNLVGLDPIWRCLPPGSCCMRCSMPFFCRRFTRTATRWAWHLSRRLFPPRWR